MSIRVAKGTLPEWANGDYDRYQSYVTVVARGGVFQDSTRVFTFRSNLRTDIWDWLVVSCQFDGILRTNPNDYIGQVEFADDKGAAFFKLKWC